jgi:hypothetical protein
MAKQYEDVTRSFAGLPIVIAGGQPQRVDDPRVIGFVPEPERQQLLRDFRVMLYTSREPRQVMFDVWEAMVFGMPVVFLSGGLLEQLSGNKHPGCCETYQQAREALEQLLAGNMALADAIRAEQQPILRSIAPAALKALWQERFIQGALGRDFKVASTQEPSFAECSAASGTERIF